MDNEEIITVNNTGGKGNPNHKPAGSSEGGQFTSGPESGTEGGSISNKWKSFLSSKKSDVTPIVSTYTLDDILKNNVVGKFNLKDFESPFNAGTEKARQIIGDFFKSTNVKIDRDGKGARYNPFYSRIFLENADLKAQGKHAGYYEIGETFYHEIFHGVDDKYGQLTTEYILSNGKTLKDTFHHEIASKKYSWNMNLFNEVKADYEKAVQEEMSKMFTPEQVKEYTEKKEYYRKAMSDLNNSFDNNKFHYKSIQAYYDAYDEYHNKFKELKKEWKKYNDIFLPAQQKATHKYSCLSDFCSFVYRTGLNQSICGGHPKNYWSQDGGAKAIKEMWAEVGSMWARGKSEDVERMRKYFPETISMIEEVIGKLDDIRKGKFGE